MIPDSFTHSLAAANPAKQIVAWGAELVASIAQNWGSVSTALAIAAAAYLAMTLGERWLGGDSTDPSYWFRKESDAGSVSAMVSGVYLTTMVVSAIAFFTWPLAVENPAVGAALLLVVTAHYYTEKQEVAG